MIHPFRSRVVRFGAPMLMVTAVALAAGPAAAFSYYLGDGLPTVAAKDRAPVAHPQPVQLIVQFDKNGVQTPNGKGTPILDGKVLDDVKASGVFGDVSDKPVASGAVLKIVINNVATPAEEAAASQQGYRSGATLGLVSGSATDHYVCTVEFTPSASAPKLTETASQSLLVQAGLFASQPPHQIKEPTFHDAVFEMLAEMTSNTLNALAKEPTFQAAAGPGS